MDDSMDCAPRHSAQRASLGDKNLLKEINVDPVSVLGDTRVHRSIALVECSAFLCRCIQNCLENEFRLRLFAYSAVSEFSSDFLHVHRDDWPSLVLLSLVGATNQRGEALRELPKFASTVPVIVLASENDPALARNVILNGAKGYIPVTLGFDIAVEAVRFVLAGGTYVPVEYLIRPEVSCAIMQSSPSLSSRELAIVRAIQQGKLNKIIAYELGICESTVKVHLRNVMKKLNAKNRTDVAIKTQTRMG